MFTLNRVFLHVHCCTTTQWVRSIIYIAIKMFLVSSSCFPYFVFFWLSKTFQFYIETDYIRLQSDLTSVHVSLYLALTFQMFNLIDNSPSWKRLESLIWNQYNTYMSSSLQTVPVISWQHGKIFLSQSYLIYGFCYILWQDQPYAYKFN